MTFCKYIRQIMPFVVDVLCNSCYDCKAGVYTIGAAPFVVGALINGLEASLSRLSPRRHLPVMAKCHSCRLSCSIIGYNFLVFAFDGITGIALLSTGLSYDAC